MNSTWVLYDASCLFCIAGVNAFKSTLNKRNCKIKPLQDKTVMKILNVKEGDDFPEMKVIGDDYKVYGGARAIVYICRKIWWASPVWALAHLPGTMPILDFIYKEVAKRRHCHGQCEI
jgi:predicted DCC family thiol-disulfide oxidoreductase YuxK|tara:strand:+ start:1783 stop:2136 length:354 start_codon:yes stop_codon:yes gene_type:complete